jgi:hypothetical protein
MMKYLVSFFYTLDEDTTFKYDAGCKEFLNSVNNPGVVVVTTEPSLDLLKIQLLDLLQKFSTKYEIPDMLPTSFEVKVFELRGVNDDCDAITIGPSGSTENVQVYVGKLTDLKQ